jgi:predicted metallopeptidase
MSNGLFVNVGDILIAARTPKYKEKKKFSPCYVIEICDPLFNDDDDEQRFKVMYFDNSHVQTLRTSEFAKWWEFMKR